MSLRNNNGRRAIFLCAVLAVFFLFNLQGCVATRNWVKEQMDPMSARISEGEERMSQTDAKVDGLGRRLSDTEGRLGNAESRIGQVDAKAEQALHRLANLRVEKRLVLDLREGTHFGFNSTALPAEARKEIDGFLSDLKGDPSGLEGTVFLVAGHTDSTGPEDYNYELGRKRADNVSRYLITQKQMDPLRVVTVSYGENAPIADNKSREGRAKNRRVEILVYRESLTSEARAQ